MVENFEKYARSHEKTVTRKEIIPEGAVKALYTDLYIREPNLLVEAKGATTRAAIRMAIGQLADYRRFLDEPRCAILVPEKPSQDILELAAVEKIVVVWPSENRFDSTVDLW